MKFSEGTKVEWKWLGRTIRGVVVQAFQTPVVREIKGKKIKRNGSPENPAHLVRSDAGNEALKLGSELSPAKRPAKNSPRMFGP